MHPDQLATLEAIAETGTFEAAAARLGISPSAASQRIRALESALGRILVQRTTPCAMTDDGAVVLRYARAQALLAREMAAELASASGAAPAVGTGGVGTVELTVAVNVDSLDTWFTGVLRRAADWPCRLRLYPELAHLVSWWMLLRAWVRSGGSGSAAVRVCPAMLMVMVR